MLELFPFIGQCWNLIQSILIFSENNHCVHQTMLDIIEWIRTLSYLFFSRENDSLFLELMGKESNLALHDPHPAPAVFLSLHLHSQDGTTLQLFLSLSQDLYFSSSSKNKILVRHTKENRWCKLSEKSFKSFLYFMSPCVQVKLICQSGTQFCHPAV